MDDVNFAEGFISELEAETTSSRKCIERIPADKFNWKPHERSMEMGYLTLLVAEIPLWIAHIITDDEIDLATFAHLKSKDPEEWVRHFDENVEKAKAALSGIKNGDLDKKFELKVNGQVVMGGTRRDHLSSCINHMVHHRGQLTVYMRLNDIQVPSIYGPSADDRNFNYFIKK